MSSKVQNINVLALAALDLDCRRLALFATKTGVPDLFKCFGELHEIVLVCIHPDLTKLADDEAYRQRLFPRIDGNKLCTFLDKMVPVAASINVAALPRHDKNTLKNASKKIKAQMDKRN